MAGYYDYVLGVIPLSLFGITGSLSVVGLSVTHAVPVAATVALVVILHAMFVNAPVATETVGEVSTPHSKTINAD
jgi:hypothetical protein